MVGIRMVESENWRKEENATVPEKLGKNFLAKSSRRRKTRDSSPGFARESRLQNEPEDAPRKVGPPKIEHGWSNSSRILLGAVSLFL